MVYTRPRLDGARKSIGFPLPLPSNRFCESVALQPAAFMSTWKSIDVATAPESQFVVVPAGGADVGALRAKLTALNLGEVRHCPFFLWQSSWIFSGNRVLAHHPQSPPAWE